MRALLEELQLTDRLRWGYAGSGFYTDGRFHSLTTTLDFLRFPPLRLWDKVRLAATILRAANLRDWQSLEGETAADWLVRWSGRRTYDRLWRPLLRAKLGENAELASAAFIWAIIARMYAARRSGLKREMFGYVEGGYATILERFRACSPAPASSSAVVRRRGASIRRARREHHAGRWHAPDERVRDPDRTLRTGRRAVPAVRAAGAGPFEERGLSGHRLCVPAPPETARGILRDEHHGAWVPFTAVIEMTALVDRERFGGNSLVYLPRYASQDDPIWQRSDAEVVSEFVAGLREDVSRISTSPTWWRCRWPAPARCSPFRPALQRAVPPADATSLGNVFVVNSAQIAQGTLNVNETVGWRTPRPARSFPSLTARPTARRSEPAPDDGERPRQPVAGSRQPLVVHEDPWRRRLGEPALVPPTLVPRLLDLLDQAKINVTFFLVGVDAAAARNRELFRRSLGEATRSATIPSSTSPGCISIPRHGSRRKCERTEEAIEAATGRRPRGFRGPGYSWSPDLFRVLLDRGYGYDASTLPTYLGPLARAYYFRTTRLSAEQRAERAGSSANSPTAFVRSSRTAGGWPTVGSCWRFR